MFQTSFVLFRSAVECIYAVNDEVFVGGSSSNKLYVWHSSRGSPVFTVSSAHPVPRRLDPSPEESHFRHPIANWVTAIAGLPGTDLIATGSTTGHVQLWRVVLPGQYHGETMPGTEAQQLRTHIKLERLSGCSMALVSTSLSKNSYDDLSTVYTMTTGQPITCRQEHEVNPTAVEKFTPKD
ncbi:U3 small nucleolar RNA interacting protein 2 [Fasciola gigantica]|uniref:U3 small nucleolar RNA interacting protein 2 n=1 Tax=Fasciola gigantica TaxID=46835 RepID=A0A504Y7L8_FASGI|nr:U3 small nucleolar RNA interacting protein 2 [Fasciola gigantica]